MPYNSPMKKKGSSCMQMKDHKGKPSGLMMEGSVAYQESAEQKTKDLMKDMPVDAKASAMEMSPYKMGHESPAEFTGMSGGSALHDNHDKDERSGKGKSMTEGVELGEATASLSDMYKRDAALTVPDFPNLREDTSGRMFVQGQPTGSHPYIGRGSFVEGSVGSVYTPEQISAGRKQHETLKAKKEKAKSWLAANM